MLLPRRHYLALAGIAEQLFKSLQRRNQVPLFGVTSLHRPRDENEALTFHEKMEARGYTAADAILLAASDHLATVNSFSRDSAKVFLESHPELTVLGIRRVEAGEDIWIGAYSTETKGSRITRDQDGNVTPVHSFGAIGTLIEVMDQIKDDLARWGDEGRAINLINLTPIVRTARAEAEKIGLTGSFVD
jgi:hypothetical protein